MLYESSIENMGAPSQNGEDPIVDSQPAPSLKKQGEESGKVDNALGVESEIEDRVPLLNMSTYISRITEEGRESGKTTGDVGNEINTFVSDVLNNFCLAPSSRRWTSESRKL